MKGAQQTVPHEGGARAAAATREAAAEGGGGGGEGCEGGGCEGGGCEGGVVVAAGIGTCGHKRTYVRGESTGQDRDLGAGQGERHLLYRLFLLLVILTMNLRWRKPTWVSVQEHRAGGRYMGQGGTWGRESQLLASTGPEPKMDRLDGPVEWTGPATGRRLAWDPICVWEQGNRVHGACDWVGTDSRSRIGWHVLPQRSNLLCRGVLLPQCAPHARVADVTSC